MSIIGQSHFTCRLCGGGQLKLHLHAYDVRVVMDGTRYDVYRCEGCGGVFLDDRALRQDVDYYGSQYYSLTAIPEQELARISARRRPRQTPCACWMSDAARGLAVPKTGGRARSMGCGY